MRDILTQPEAGGRKRAEAGSRKPEAVYDPILNAMVCWAVPDGALASTWIRYSPGASDASGKSIWKGLPSTACTGTSAIDAPVRLRSLAVISGFAPPAA